MSNSSVNTLPNTEEIQYSEIYITALENQANIAKMNELESWKKQEVYCEEEDIGQSFISVTWVLSRKTKNGENVKKPGSLPAASKKLRTSLQIHHDCNWTRTHNHLVHKRTCLFMN